MRLQSKIMAAVLPLLLVVVVIMTGVVNYYAQVGGVRLADIILQLGLEQVDQVLSQEYGRLAVRGETGNPEAVAAAQKTVLQQFQQLRLPAPLYLFVVDAKGTVLYHPNTDWIGQDIQQTSLWAQLQSQLPNSTFTALSLTNTTDLVRYYYFAGWGWYLGLTGTTAFFQSDIYRGINTSVSVAFIALVLVSVALYLLARQLTRPLLMLVDGATKIGSGELEFEIEKISADEAGVLVDAFNQMRLQLVNVIGNLEERVAERTQAVEDRSLMLERTAQLARDVAAIQDVRLLPEQAVHLIAERLGFYHVGLFLIDAARENAILAAASSEGGQRMLARGHRRRMGEGIVGTVAQTGMARIALDVDADQVWVRNPDLPETRSEMALPLKGRQQIIGVLDVQSEQGAAFSQADVATLQTLAEQVALALENARLLAESEQARLALEAAYGQQVVAYWREQAAQRPRAYLYNRAVVEPISPERAQALLAAPAVGLTGPTVQPGYDGRRLIAPLRLREQTVGAIVLQRTLEQAPWSPQELAVVETITTQAMQALEIARLLEETRARVAREQLLGQLSEAFSRSLDVESVLQTAVRELGRLLEMDEVTAHIGTPPEA